VEGWGWLDEEIGGLEIGDKSLGGVRGLVELCFRVWFN